MQPVRICIWAVSQWHGGRSGAVLCCGRYNKRKSINTDATWPIFPKLPRARVIIDELFVRRSRSVEGCHCSWKASHG